MDITYKLSASELSALERCLAEQQAADPQNAPADVPALFQALAADRVNGVVQHYQIKDAAADKAAILAAYEADPTGITSKLAAEIAAVT